MSPDETPAPNFKLDGDPARGRITREQLERWASIYGRGGRTLRRWIEVGEEHGDPCPLDQPGLMPDWWERQRNAGRIAWRCPDEVKKAAESARSAPAAASAAASEGSSSSTSEQKPGAEIRSDPINLEDFDPDEANEIRELQILKAAKWSQIVKLLKEGRPCDSLQNEHRRLAEQIDKMKSRAEQRLQKRGILVNVHVVQADVDTACELIRQLGESEARRILELVPGLTPEQTVALVTAVRTMTSARNRVFRNLKSLRSVSEGVAEFERAA